MRIEKKELDALTAELTIVIEKDDYLNEYKDQLKTYQQKAAMKGFRKGKTPLGLIQKMYGAGAMQESVSKILGNKINDIIGGDEFNIIGEPLFLDEDNVPVIDHLNPTEYAYRFEIGLEPEFTPQGAEESDVYEKYNVVISDAMIDEEVEELKKKFGEQKDVEDKIVEGDVIYLSVKELDGKDFKAEGLESEFSVQLNDLSDKNKKAFLKLKASENIDFDIFSLEKEMSRENVYKYLLKTPMPTEEEEGSDEKMFRGQITRVVRNLPGEFNQELFDKYFGPEKVKSEEEARGEIKSYINDYYTNETTNYLNREIMEALVAKNKFDLPENFIKKWVNREQEMPEDKFSNFIEEMKWRVIKKKLVKRFEVEVKEQEILNYFIGMIRNYSPYIDEATLKNTAFSLMKNREQVNSAIEAVSSSKLFEEIRKVVKTTDKDIDRDAFLEKVKEINERMK